MTNLCRDEVTAILKDKIEAVWGGSFNVNGLGGVITCGVTGFGAGLSHAPVCKVCWCVCRRERVLLGSGTHTRSLAPPPRPKQQTVYSRNRPTPCP